MAKPFDYSKWDKIELSDDEEDVHPNIDKDSWFRWKHQARVEREEREARERQEIEEKDKLAAARQVELLAQLRALEEGVEDGASKAEEEGLKAELAELEAAAAARRARLEEMERNRKLNVDNIGTVVTDFTSINRREAPPDVLPEDAAAAPLEEGMGKVALQEEGAAAASSSKPAAAAVKGGSSGGSSGKASGGEAKEGGEGKAGKAAAGAGGAGGKGEVGPPSEMDTVEHYNNFALTHERLLEAFSELASLEQSKEMLHAQGHILLAEHAQSYLLLSCLEDEMNGKHDRMKNTARQSQLLTHISELARSLGRSPRDVVLPFFKRLESAEHLAGLNEAVRDFIAKIEKRAVEKRKEMALDDEAEEEMDEAARLGPGGLDPVKVFEALPVALQEAFESRDMGRLHAALAALPVEEAKRHMKACADSGLWVPARASDLEEEAAAAEEEEAGAGAAAKEGSG